MNIPATEPARPAGWRAEYHVRIEGFGRVATHSDWSEARAACMDLRAGGLPAVIDARASRLA